MSPFSSVWTPKRGGSSTNAPADDLQLRVQTSRESGTTATPTLDARTSSVPTLAPPRSHHSSRQLQDDALGEFFGGRSHRPRTQYLAPPSPDWHNEKLPKSASASASSLTPDSEVDTVARRLFKYGFFFPFFWAIGVYLLFAPMHVSEDWQSDRTVAEKDKMRAEMREAELKWARRCLWALLSFFACLAIIIALVISRR